MTAPPRRPVLRRFPLPGASAALAAGAVLGVLAVLLTGGCSAAPPPGSGPASASPTRAARAAAPAIANELEDDYQAVIRSALPSVVQIEAGAAIGSGIVYDDRGHIVTNAHVVGAGRTFRVTVASGAQPLSATLVAAYPEQDLAVIKLDSLPDGLRPARFGDSATVEVGQIVLAMGSPLGLSSSVTQGIVSATGRTVTAGTDGRGTGATIPNMVQTSAAINPGNSGGALVDLDGEVIGIPTLAARDPGLGEGAAPGIGFAIPVSMVRTVADQIIESGRVTDSGRAALGITGRTVLDDDLNPSGVAVVEVVDGGPAQRAGLRAGDVITRVGDAEITTITSLAEALAVLRPGDEVPVAYERGAQRRTAEVTLGEV